MGYKYYTDYVNYMLRNYVRGGHEDNPVTRYNNRVCQDIVERLADEDRAVIETVYNTQAVNLTAAVDAYCGTSGKDRKAVLSLIAKVSRDIKDARGL